MEDLFQELHLTPFGAVPSERQICHLRDYNKKAFFHFGVNTFTDKEWGEGEEPEKVFDPSELDIRQWIKTIKAAGFTLAILTTKHHDGFCLWPSKYTEHSVKNSPYKNGEGDIVREFVDACREFDIKCGFYCSPWDRHSPYWGTSEYNRFYNDQLTELMTQYGRIDEVWWDGAGSHEANYDCGLWAHTIRNYQPQAVIFGSLKATPYVECRWVGTEGGYAGDPHYSTISNAAMAVENTSEMNSGLFGGERFIPGEADVSIRSGWFYHKEQDTEVKSVRWLVDYWFHSIGRSCMMLLNFPPDRRGLVHEIDAARVVEADRIIKQTFAVNLAANGKATADSVRDLRCEPDMILNDCYDNFYAAADGDLTPTVEIKLPAPVEFDTFTIGEKIELGIRVKEYRVEAMVEGEWKVLAHKRSIGHLWAERFERVCTDRVRIVICDAAAEPVIRSFGLYKMPDAYYAKTQEEKKQLASAVDLVSGSSARLIEEDEGVRVEFGGIYPFNTVSFNATGVFRYEIYAFNGSDFYPIYKGIKPEQNSVVRLDKTITDSYQLRIVTHKKDNSKLNLKVFAL